MGDGTVTATISGLDGLEQKLNQLAPKAARSAIRKAARQAGQIWQEAIKERVPVKTGQEQESISVVTSAGAGEDDGTTGSVTVSVGPTKRGFYEQWQEFGSIHQPATPVLQPVADETEGRVLDAFVENLNEILEGLAE
jgi:HK97 gp10 family phage protein